MTSGQSIERSATAEAEPSTSLAAQQADAVPRETRVPEPLGQWKWQEVVPWRLARWMRWMRWASARARLRWQRIALGCASALALALLALTWAWNATPSTAGLGEWVRTQDVVQGAPYTPLADISPWMGRALVTIEDERFYQHHGIDTAGLLRAAWDDLQAGSFVEGGSTLTAQLAKNAYLQGHDHTVPRKAEDLVLALKVEQRYSKAQILEMYLNLVYFGEGAYGIGAASQRYFAVAPSRLDIAQAALLTGLVQAPGLYDPWCHADLARMRQQTVLYRMLADGYITAAQARTAEGERFAFWTTSAKRPADAYCAG
jgi:membrane peptidoglycan carboxypeptidase